MHQAAVAAPTVFILLVLVLAANTSSAAAGRLPQQQVTATGASTAPQHDGPHLWDEDDPRHLQMIQQVGRIMLEHNDPASASTTTTAVAVPVDVDDAPAAAATGSSSTALAVMQDGAAAAVDPWVMAAAQMMGLNASIPAVARYVRVRTTRIMLLLSDLAWLVYAAGNLAQRAFALLVPVVRIGQTGELTISAASFLSLAQLVADFWARFNDMLAKALLVVFRGITLAATLPPKV